MAHTVPHCAFHTQHTTNDSQVRRPVGHLYDTQEDDFSFDDDMEFIGFDDDISYAEHLDLGCPPWCVSTHKKFGLHSFVLFHPSVQTTKKEEKVALNKTHFGFRKGAHLRSHKLHPSTPPPHRHHFETGVKTTISTAATARCPSEERRTTCRPTRTCSKTPTTTTTPPRTPP